MSSTRLVLSSDGRQLVVRSRNFDNDLEICDRVLDSLILEDVTVDGDLTLRACQAQRLALHKVWVRGTVVIRDCSLGNLDLRQVRAIERCCLIRVRTADAVLHEVPALDLLDVTSTGVLRVSAPKTALELKDVHAQDFEITDCPHRDLIIRGRRMQLTGLFSMRDLVVSRVSLSDSSFDRLRVANCATQQAGLLKLTDCTLTGSMVIETSSASEAVFASTGCRVGSDLELRDLHRQSDTTESEHSSIVARLTETTIAGDLRLTAGSSSQRQILELSDSSVGGQLSVRGSDDGERQMVLHLAGRSDIADVMIPADPPITFRNAEQVLLSLFDRVDRAALQTMRRALNREQRHGEADAVYYRERSLPVGRSRMLGQPRALVGPALGWGVRISGPMRSLLVLIALASFTTYVYAAVYGNCVTHGRAQICVTAGWGLRSMVSAVAEAGAAFFGVAVGSPSTPRGVLWDVFTVLGAGSGLLLTTVLVGIIIRRLVR